MHFLCLLNIFFLYCKLPVYILCSGHIPVTEHFISAAFDIVNIQVLWILFWKFILNWRIIALQCCVCSAIWQSKSAMSIHLSPPSFFFFLLSLSVLFPVCRDDIQHHTHSHAHTHILHPPELARHTPSFWMAGTKPYVAVPKLLVTLVRFGLSERRQLNI